MSLVTFLVRLKFKLTSREAATQLIRDELEKTIAIAGELGPDGCRKSVTCPKMLGIDEDMRDWNFYQILEHNRIANDRIAGYALFLAGKGPQPDPNFDSKHDVMPTANAGLDEIEALEKSVEDYLQLLTTVETLKGTEEVNHPIFGPFDAHKWHCMAGFHLQLHRKQAESLVPLINGKKSREGDL